MWICSNCQSENEEAFRFCWRCGKPQGAAETAAQPPPPALIQDSVEPESNAVPVEPVQRHETLEASRSPIAPVNAPPAGRQAVEKRDEPESGEQPARKTETPVKTAEALDYPETAVRGETPAAPAMTAPKTVPVDDDVLPMLKRVAGIDDAGRSTDEDSSLERKVFTIAVRLLGLYFIFRVLAALPELTALVYSALASETGSGGFSDVFFTTLLRPVATALFYLIVGLYLIASGAILLWLLPRR